MVQIPEDLQLLSAILPSFLKLASFFTSNHRTAIAARSELGDAEPFYTNLHIELKGLHDILSGYSGEVIEVPESTKRVLDKVLGALESRVVAHSPITFQSLHKSNDQDSRKKYGRLSYLATQCKDAHNETELTLNDLRKLIRLKDERKPHRIHLIKRLTELNRELGKVLKTKAQRLPLADAAHTLPRKTLSRLPSSNIRERANLCHILLNRYWKCKDHAPHTAAKLRLATYRSFNGEVRFEMLLCTASVAASGTIKWQDCEVRVVLNQKNVSSLQTDGTVNLPLNAKPRRRVVWADLKIPSPTRTPSPSKARASMIGNSSKSKRTSSIEEKVGTSLTKNLKEERWQVDGICNLLQKYAHDTSLRVRLLVDNDQLWYQPPNVSPQIFNSMEQVNLIDLIQSKVRARRIDRCKLAVIIANSFLHLSGGPWLGKDWDKTQICFYPARGQTEPNLSRSYLSTQCDGSMERKHDHQEQSRFRYHPYPSILALGILLLEIELRQGIEQRRPPDSPNNGQNYNIDADWPVAVEMFEECIGEGESSVYFQSAVRACLDAKTFADGFGRDATFDNHDFRQQIYAYIVQPLERALSDVWEGSVEELDTISSPPPPGLSFLPTQRHVSFRPAFAAGLSQTQLMKPRAVAAEKYSHHLPPDIPQFDATNMDHSIQQHMRCVDAWFLKLHERFHPLLQNTDRIYPSIESIFKRARRIRVAILDTGAEFPEEAEYEYRHRIKDYKSWLCSSASEKDLERGDRDLDGHGTHAAALILRLAPDAELYIARVFKSRRESKGKIPAAIIHQRIADAINHAIAKWEVDIISMSFGFEQSVPVVDEAIKQADSQKIIMFAAASNEGGNDDIPWPARLPTVICIYATDSEGNRCHFTPTENPRSDNFSLPGLDVESDWPSHLDQSGRMRKSGTSIATPIAASIAASILAYVKMVLAIHFGSLKGNDVETFRKMRTAAGMSTVFRLMVKKRGGMIMLFRGSSLMQGHMGTRLTQFVI